MIHNMNLRPAPFEAIASNTKKIEMRLYDEKRKTINLGDSIIFKNQETTQTCTKKVIGLHIYENFEGLYKLFDKTLLGYEKDQPAHYTDMLDYYPQEEIDKYGVVGIELE